MAEQLSNKDGVIRVQMNPDELRRMLDPILKEVNELRKRVAKIEKWQEATQEFCEATDLSLLRLEELIEPTLDDGK